MFRAKATFEALARTSVEAYFHGVSVIRNWQRNEIYSDSLKVELGGYSAQQVFDRHAVRAGTDDPLALIQYIDLHTYLIGDINTKVDRASMAHSLEVREPLMDHPLVEWLATLPTSLKIRSGESKFLLKKAMEPYLPPDIMYRPKMGFAVPLARWFRGPLRQRVRDELLGGPMLETGWFNRDTIRQIVEQHESGMRDHSTPIWVLLMFDAFLRNNVESTAA
jgi:asparagine synthase (glutamine-hydrolysing)